MPFEIKNYEYPENKKTNALSAILEGVKRQGEAFEEFKDGFQNRLEMLEARASNPGKSARPGESRIQSEHKDLFCAWLKKPDDQSRIQALQNIEAELSKKNVLIGNDISGGFAVPEIIARQIERHELLYSPVRRLVKVVPAASSDYKELLSERLPSSGQAGWSSETGTRSGTASPTLRQIAPTHGELYAYPTASNWSLQDIFFNVDQWLSEEIGDTFAQLTGQAVISGSGTNRPTGMLNTTPTLGEDFGSPLRDADAYEYVVSDTDVDSSPSEPGIRSDSLIDLVYKLRAPYRARAVWTMNSTTVGTIRKLKDTQNRYLWTDGLGETPPRLLGYPVEVWEDMPDVGAGNFPVAFGDFRRGYVLVDIQGMRIIRDEVTTPGFTKFYVSRRLAGRPLNNDAIKFLRTID